MNQFAIHESNIERLEKKINRIRRKCENYGCGFHYERVGEEFRTLGADTPDERVEKYIIVEAEGTAVVNGWTFAGSIEHDERGNIIRSFLDVEVPARYYTCEPECEHCRSRRHRKETYLVYNEETKEFKQVGSSCLMDFTGGLSAEGVAGYISMYDELIQGETPVGGSTATPYYDVKELLGYTYLLVKAVGYVSSSSDYYNSTKSTVGSIWNYEHGRAHKFEKIAVEELYTKYNPDYTSEEVTKYVDDCLEYIKSLTDDSNYIHNLLVIANAGYASGRDFGYLVSMVPCYNKHLRALEREAIIKAKQEKEASSSKLVGNVGDRVEVVPATLECIASWETQWGHTYRYKITDESGNVFMWDASTGIWSDNDIAKIKGSVKKHDEYRGVAQTWLTRCRITYKEEERPVVTSNVVEDSLNMLYEYWEGC